MSDQTAHKLNSRRVSVSVSVHLSHFKHPTFFHECRIEMISVFNDTSVTLVRLDSKLAAVDHKQC